MYAGRHHDYYWLEGYADTALDLFNAHPEVVLGKRLLVQGYNQQVVDPAVHADWLTRSNNALSPRLSGLAQIPADSAGFVSSWLAFSQTTIADVFDTIAFPRILPPATHGGSLRDPEYVFTAAPQRRPFDPQRLADQIRDRQARFWAAIEQLNPESYIYGWRPFVFVTRNVVLHRIVEDWMRACDSAEPITATRLLDSRKVAPDRHVVDVTVGSSQEVVILTSERPLHIFARREDQRSAYYAFRQAPGPHRYRIHRQLPSGMGVIDLPETNQHFVRVQSFGKDRWLLVSTAAGGTNESSANVYSSGGRHIGSFDIGQGVEQVQDSPDGHLWVGYDDEGIYKYGGFGGDGVVCFDQEGRPVARYSDIAKQHALPFIDDCYSLNVADNRETWLYYYRSFPLVRLIDRKFDRIWRDVPVVGAHGFAIAPQRALLAGSHHYPDKLFLLDLETGSARKLQPIDHSGQRIVFDRAFGRGRVLYLRAGDELFAVQLT